MEYIFLLILLLLIFKFFSAKIHVKWYTFAKRGFRKFDNNFGLFCYTGKQGKGKTYSAINFCIEQKLKCDYTIITNIKSFNAFSDTIYMDNINDIIDYCTSFRENEKNVLILFDEIFTVLEKGTPLNKKILSFLSQLRKRQIIMVTTAQEWSEINITFRRYVRYQISCNMFSLPILKIAFCYNSINDGDLISWNNETQDFEAPRIRANFEKAQKRVVQSYDTYETINLDYSLNKKNDRVVPMRR